MKTQTVLTTILILISGAGASAQPQFQIDDGVWRPGADCGCANNPTRDFHALVQKANIIKSDVPNEPDDGRDNISKLQKKLGLTAAQVLRIRATTGYVICPGTDHDNGSGASASLMGSNMQIVTNAHVFYDKKGVARTPFSACKFRNQQEPPQEIALDFDSQSEQFGATGKLDEPDFKDFAVVRLKSPVVAKGSIEEVRPFSISKRKVAPFEELIGISSYQDIPSKEIDATEPVAQKFKVRAVWAPEGDTPTSIFSMADVEPGASGGVNFRKVGKDLEIVSIFNASGKSENNGLPYDGPTEETTRADRYMVAYSHSLTMSIGVDSLLAEDILKVKNGLPKSTKGLVFSKE